MEKTVREYSAGGIVYKKVKGQKSKIDRNRILWLVAQHSYHKGWVFPKGLIGDHKEGESKEETALREVEEETGVKARIIKKLDNPATYFYTWQGDKRFKTVYYFLMEFLSEDLGKKDTEMSEVVWISTDEVLEKLSYKSDKLAFKEALEIFDKLMK